MNGYRTQRYRPDRFDLEGQVRLLIDFDPWRLLLHLRAINLSENGLLGCLPLSGSQPSSASAGFDASDAEALLIEGDPYTLQVEHGLEHLPLPLIKGRLRRKVRTRDGFDLGFSFEDSDADVALLVSELSQASRTRK